MFYLIAAILAIGVLLLVNFLLLKFSCNNADSEKDRSKASREKTSVME